MFLVVIVSIASIIADIQLESFVKIRMYLDTAITPVYLLTNIHRKILDTVFLSLKSRSKLVLENREMHQALILKSSDQLLLDRYKQENVKLRELLGSPLKQDEHKMLSQVMFSNSNSYRDQLVIDKGVINGVYVGQPVINDKGVVGQVIAVSKFTSRILLICDPSHALPVQVFRNDVRVIMAGDGCNKDLKLEHLPVNTDIRVGDILVTSGLGGRFPEGYPVAIVSLVKINTNRGYTVIHAQPTAVDLQSLRYLILLWFKSEYNGELLLHPGEVHEVANERLMRIKSQALSVQHVDGIAP